jgi:hypothetical protein
MAYQGEYFVQRYGALAAERTPPFKRMLEMGVHVGAGTDATRGASYDPWTSLHWMVTGKTVGGLSLYPDANLVDRETALRLYTQANTWFSNEEGLKGQIKAGQYADLAVLSADYFSIPDEEIRQLVSVLTVVGGRIVYGDDEFSQLAPPLPPAMPDWSPANYYGGYFKPDCSTQHRLAKMAGGGATGCGLHGHVHGWAHTAAVADDQQQGFWGALGCSCWVF